ncbi:tetratricopeptide repeat protein [Ancylomarina longa]|uniref:Uncharacterized protein n=1 Tax=Ancylomarina longa TaxID=2487017 RepID=A0A434AZH0_9BACT|nr:tetratricopeptide repeat protein [Ancylomarina longa]RUT80018.1 hypothetical protein DLK05_01290 [Ancylomarina longa]
MNKDIEQLRKEAEQLKKAEDFAASLKKYQEIVEIDAKDLDAQFQLGEMQHQLGELTNALSTYLRVVDLDPENKKAQVKIEMIRSIMSYYNKDLINP